MADYHKCAKEIGHCKGLKKGVKGYHGCAKKSNCKKTERQKLEKIKEKVKKSTAKAIIKKVVKSKVKSKAKPKPKSKIIISDLEQRKYEIADKNYTDYKRDSNKKGELNPSMNKMACDNIKIISNTFNMFKTNNYKPRTINLNYLEDKIKGYALRSFATITYDRKPYKIPVLEIIIRVITSYYERKNDYKRDCGLEEYNILVRLHKEILEDSEKIKNSIIKSRSKYVKDIPIPSLLTKTGLEPRQELLDRLLVIWYKSSRRIEKNNILSSLTSNEDKIFTKMKIQKDKEDVKKRETIDIW